MPGYNEGYRDGFAAGFIAANSMPPPRDMDANDEPAGLTQARRPSKTTGKKRVMSDYQKWANKERKLIARQHPRFDFARTQTELSKRWKREKKKRGMK